MTTNCDGCGVPEGALHAEGCEVREIEAKAGARLYEIDIEVLILPGEGGEAAWLVLVGDDDDPTDVDAWRAEISLAEWRRFDDAQKTLGEVLKTAVAASPRDEDGRWRKPCPLFYSWKFDSPAAREFGFKSQFGIGDPSADDLCSRCRHVRADHESESQ